MLWHVFQYCYKVYHTFHPQHLLAPAMNHERAVIHVGCFSIGKGTLHGRGMLGSILIETSAVLPMGDESSTTFVCSALCH